MGINVKGLLGGAARVAAGAALLVAAGSAFAPAHAKKLSALIGSGQGSVDGPGPLLSTYFDLGYGWGSDDVVRLTNPSGADVCAMIYVFDTDQELQEACAIGLSPNKALSLDVASDLTATPTYGSFYNYDIAGIIEIISATPNTVTSPYGSTTEGISCDPAVGVAPITGVNAYLEESVVVESYGEWLPSAAVLAFTDDGTIDQTNLSTITTALSVLGSEIGSSGRGICLTDPWQAPDLAS
jgi:hypothetical protein